MLLHSITFSNFYSFRDEQTVSFVVNEHAPNTSGYCLSADGETRLTKLLGVFGPNAGGKTNLLRVIGFLKYFICDSFSFPPEMPIPSFPFFGGTKKGTTSRISSDFEIEDTVYRYTIEFDYQRVFFEELLSRKAAAGSRFSKNYVRKWLSKQNTYDFTVSRTSGLKSSFIDQVREKASVLRTAVQFNNPKCTLIFSGWRNSFTNAVVVGSELSLRKVVPGAISKVSSDRDLLNQVNERISEFDLGLEGFSVREFLAGDEKGEETTLFTLVGIHSDDGNGHNFELPFIYESGGTQSLFGYLSFILPVLKESGFVALDELDADLHPGMMEMVLEEFLNSGTNPKNCQLIFSCHYAPLLGLLDKYQVVLVEKDETGASEAWRLDEMAGVRADDNYFTKYITGAYGAVPNV